VARGIGPRPLRIAIAVLAGLYFGFLLWHPKPFEVTVTVTTKGSEKVTTKILWRSFVAYFAECTGLFPEADWVGKTQADKVPGSKEFRIEAWSCDRARWEMLDPRPYFPIQSEDKESRLPRIIHFYIEEGDSDQARATAHAIESFLFAHHASDGADDGVAGTIGGIRISRDARAVGAPGDDVPRYAYDPLSPMPASDHVTVLYNTTQADHDGHAGIRSRCASAESP
jgi:hypothetical protein